MVQRSPLATQSGHSWHEANLWGRRSGTNDRVERQQQNLYQFRPIFMASILCLATSI
ncbi:hypothetical protein [Stenomitos frigidus]|uniref:hypothetical protein n=1 Tax=Stenomitos frigidus TaxID=1886765 RepID=UPI0015E7C925|nr:hypothetical protein [Stenomitos frigidus]